MMILTAGDRKFKSLVQTSWNQTKKFGYSMFVYDLGGLGFGKPMTIDHRLFRENGYYWELDGGIRAPGVHKPRMIKDYLVNHCKMNEFVAYLDGDAILIDRIDEVIGDYDVGVTVRSPSEIEELKRIFNGQPRLYEGYINNGVMFFRKTEATLNFIDHWVRETDRLKTDQLGLNRLLEDHFPVIANQIIACRGVRVRTFDTRIYNNYYFLKGEQKDAKILHFKKDRRVFFDAYFKPARFQMKRLSAFISGKSLFT